MNNKTKIKINLISYNNSYGLTQDLNQLKNNLEMIFLDNIDCKFINFYDYECREADINIFLEIISNILIKHARFNILIPNQEWFYQDWKPYLGNIDLILVKTNYAYTIFSNIVSELSFKTRIDYLGWESLDKLIVNKKILRQREFIHLAGKSIYKQTQNIINFWKPEYSNLTIIYSPKDLKISPKDQTNITYITNRLSDQELNTILNQKYFHLCVSETEGFGHYINEAKSTKSIVITTQAPPMTELVSEKDGILVMSNNKKKLKDTLGTRFFIDQNDFNQKIEQIIQMSNDQLKNLGQKARQSFEDNNQQYQIKLKTIFSQIFNNLTNTPQVIFPTIENNNLPNLTVVTLVYNRKRFFKLSILNFLSSQYPRDKLEWVIIDDSKPDQIVKDLVPKQDNIHYYYYDEHLNIGQKRNIGVEKANFDYIAFMDDDDYYPPESLSKRMINLLHYNKQCSTCTSISCFHINKYISMINVPPHQLSFEERISEATLCFSKSFWKQQKFLDGSKGGEAREFLKNRSSQCIELSWKDIIVSLLHSSNTSTRVTVTEEPNGCHFGFSDKLFSFITNLDTDSK